MSTYGRDRVRRVQGLRRSNAATPHGTGRRPAPDLMDALQDSLDEDKEARDACDVPIYEVLNESDDSGH